MAKAMKLPEAPESSFPGRPEMLLLKEEGL